MPDHNETQSPNASVELLRLIKAPLGIFAACLILLFGTLDLVALSSDSTNFKLVLLANLAIILIVALLAIFRPEALAGTRRERPIDERALISPYETRINQLMKENDQLQSTVRSFEKRVTNLESDLTKVNSLRSQIWALISIRSKPVHEIVSSLGMSNDPAALQEVRGILGEWFEDGKIEVDPGAIESVRPTRKF